ncbi:peroxidasin-like [Lytechinus variegatus]|uniref:peroxidasin-like n=1 Tax=Lytechinus variegatus TaxID=7654 RepID=UPI001BB271A5|nr:peroxidasin-like [Lytechinus variegatus]XP_041470780.1 peroxidasin-like [Lytechinus variegatus]
MTSVEFECTADGNPKVLNFAWYLNRLTLNNSTRHRIILDRLQSKTVSTSRLIINDVQRMRSGKYQCHVITVLGNASATLNFSYCLAEFTVALEPPVNLPIMGEDFTMTCSYWPPLPGSVIKWSHGQGNVIATFDQESYKIRYSILDQLRFKLTGDNNSSSITINNLNTDDSGNYTCIVLNHNGRKSSTLALEVLCPAPPSDVIISDIHGGYHEYSYVTMTTGDQQNITCTVRGARPPALIEWSTDVERIQVMDQINVVKSQSYVSHRVATITPFPLETEMCSKQHCPSFGKVASGNSTPRSPTMTSLPSEIIFNFLVSTRTSSASSESHGGEQAYM